MPAASGKGAQLLLPPNLPAELRSIIEQLVKEGVPTIDAPYQLNVSSQYEMVIVPVALAASSLMAPGVGLNLQSQLHYTPQQEPTADDASVWSYEGRRQTFRFFWSEISCWNY